MHQSMPAFLLLSKHYLWLSHAILWIFYSTLSFATQGWILTSVSTDFKFPYLSLIQPKLFKSYLDSSTFGCIRDFIHFLRNRFFSLLAYCYQMALPMETKIIIVYSLISYLKKLLMLAFNLFFRFLTFFLKFCTTSS